MKILNLTYVRGDDWEAVYDQYGHLVEEGHSIDWESLLRTNCCMITDSFWVDEDWLIGVGSFPYKLSEVQKSEV